MPPYEEIGLRLGLGLGSGGKLEVQLLFPPIWGYGIFSVQQHQVICIATIKFLLFFWKVLDFGGDWGYS